MTGPSESPPAVAEELEELTAETETGCAELATVKKANADIAVAVRKMQGNVFIVLFKDCNQRAGSTISNRHSVW